MTNEIETMTTVAIFDVSILDELYLEETTVYAANNAELVEVKTLATAKKRLPGATIYAPVAEGFLVFPTMTDYLNYCRATDQLSTKHLVAL